MELHLLTRNFGESPFSELVADDTTDSVKVIESENVSVEKESLLEDTEGETNDSD